MQSRNARRKESTQMERLIEQEVAVLRQLEQGKTLSEAEAELAIPHRTMKRHVANIVAKLNALLDGAD